MEVVSQVAMNLLDLQDNSYIRLDHLRQLEIIFFCGMKPEMDFVRVILAKSPMLEKVFLASGRMFDLQEGFQTVKMLLELPRASSRAKIIVDL